MNNEQHDELIGLTGIIRMELTKATQMNTNYKPHIDGNIYDLFIFIYFVVMCNEEH